MCVSESASHELLGRIRGPLRFRTIRHHTLAASARQTFGLGMSAYHPQYFDWNLRRC